MAKHLIGSLMLILFLISCTKESEHFSTEPLSDYYPLQVGKFITYNMDSTVYYFRFGEKDSVIHYQAQDRVDAEITDNLGRASFRILRFIRQDSSQPWVPNNTFMVTPTENSIEYLENNLRFIKLKSPVRKDHSWKGNSFIDTYSTANDLQYFDDWDYTYDSLGQPIVINNLHFDSTLTVLERDEFLGQDPSIPGTPYAEKTYSIEKYGKGIGLIYRQFLHWEYQGSQTGTQGYYTGYGITLSIIDHN